MDVFQSVSGSSSVALHNQVIFVLVADITVHMKKAAFGHMTASTRIAPHL